MAINAAKVDARDAAKGVTVNVQIAGTREVGARMVLTRWLLRLAALACPCRMAVSVGIGSEEQEGKPCRYCGEPAADRCVKCFHVDSKDTGQAYLNGEPVKNAIGGRVGRDGYIEVYRTPAEVKGNHIARDRIIGNVSVRLGENPTDFA